MTKNTILLQLGMGRFGNAKKADISEIRSAADVDMLKLSKVLLDCPEYKAIEAYDNKTSEWIRNRSLPSLFQKGVYEIKLSFLELIDNTLQKREEGRAVLIERLMITYERRKGEAKGRLGPQFKEEDYPNPKRFRELFYTSWRFFELNTPDSLGEYNLEIFKRENAKREALFEEARAQGRALVVAGFQKYVDHLIEKLTPSKDGEKKKRFVVGEQRGTLTGIKEFINTFDFKDIGDDIQLQAVVNKTKKLLDGVSPEQLKDDDSTKEYVLGRFKGIAEDLEPLMEIRPKRQIEV